MDVAANFFDRVFVHPEEKEVELELWRLRLQSECQRTLAMAQARLEVSKANLKALDLQRVQDDCHLLSDRVLKCEHELQQAVREIKAAGDEAQVNHLKRKAQGLMMKIEYLKNDYEEAEKKHRNLLNMASHISTFKNLLDTKLALYQQTLDDVDLQQEFQSLFNKQIDFISSINSVKRELQTHHRLSKYIEADKTSTEILLRDTDDTSNFKKQLEELLCDDDGRVPPHDTGRERTGPSRSAVRVVEPAV